MTLTPTPRSIVTPNVARFHLHHVIYAPAKFAVATSHGLGEDAFTRNLTEGQWTDFGENL